MKIIRAMGLSMVLMVAAQVSSAATVTNMDFETGALSPWMGTGAVTSVPSEVYAGGFAGKIVGNEFLSQTVNLVAGTTYDFFWRFISGDELPFNDTAFVVTSNGYSMLSSVQSVGGVVGGDSGWQYFSWVPTMNYSGPIFFGIANLRDSLEDSVLLIDAPSLVSLPIPASALLFGSALLGVGALKRRKKITTTSGNQAST